MNTYKRFILIFCISAFFNIFLADALAYSFDNEDTRKRFRDIKELAVGVSISVNQFGFDAWELQKHIFKRLKNAGINAVLPGKSDISTPALHLNINVTKIDSPIKTEYCNYCVFVGIELWEQVILVSYPSKRFRAPTWSSGIVTEI